MKEEITRFFMGFYHALNANTRLNQLNVEELNSYSVYLTKKREGNEVPFGKPKKTIESHFEKMGEEYLNGFLFSCGNVDKLIHKNAYDVAIKLKEKYSKK
ncbi:hypothetical protein GW932_00550 [archaeon]|nr:hypothetical protein [archaeon]